MPAENPKAVIGCARHIALGLHCFNYIHLSCIYTISFFSEMLIQKYLVSLYILSTFLKFFGSLVHSLFLCSKHVRTQSSFLAIFPLAMLLRCSMLTAFTT